MTDEESELDLSLLPVLREIEELIESYLMTCSQTIEWTRRLDSPAVKMTLNMAVMDGVHIAHASGVTWVFPLPSDIGER